MPTSAEHWTDRKRRIAAMIVAGYPRKDISARLDISLTTVGREIDSLVALTGAKTPQRLPALLQADFPDQLADVRSDEDGDTIRAAALHRQLTILFTAVTFSLVVTGYGMHLLSTAYEVWGFRGFDPTFTMVATKVTYVGLGLLLFFFGGRTERECALVWIAMTILDNFVLDHLLGHAPGEQMEAWRTGYLEWVVENSLFLLGFGAVYWRHRQFYVLVLIAAQVFSLVIHAFQTASGALAPFAYAASIAIPYYFLWVVLATGLCFEFSRSPRRWRPFLARFH